MATGTVAIFAIILGIIQLIFVNIFWIFHLRHHKANAVYRIRHPYFWYICLMSGCIQLSFRGVIGYSLFSHHISIQVFQLLNRAILVFVSFGFPFTRMLLLWYTVKKQRWEQDTLIKRYLLTEEEINNNNNNHSRQKSIFDVELPKESESIPDPFIYKYSRCFGQPKRLFPLLLAIFFTFYIIQMCIGFLHNNRLSQFLVAIFALTLVVMISYISIALWCCTKKSQQHANQSMYVGSFKDTFKFRLELSLLLILLCISTPITSTIALRHNNNDYGISVGIIVACIVNTIGILIQIILPYITYKQNYSTFNEPSRNNAFADSRAPSMTNTTIVYSKKKSFESSTNKKRTVSLLDILRHKYGFYLFINQLVQELSFENLSILIEIYQFKHVTNDNHKGFHKISKFKTHFKRPSIKLKRKKKKEKKMLKREKEKAMRNNSNGNNNNKHKSMELEIPNEAPGKLADIPSGQSMDYDEEEFDLNGVINNNKKESSPVPRLEKDVSATREHSISSLLSGGRNTTPTTTDIELSVTQTYTIESSISTQNHSEYDHHRFNVTAQRRSVSDHDYFSKLLDRMPWHGIPLAKSITSDDHHLYHKLKQAQNIYNKYLPRSSSHTVNVSSSAYHRVEDKLNQLIQWKMDNQDKFDVIHEKNDIDDDDDDDGIHIVTLNNDQDEDKTAQRVNTYHVDSNGSLSPNIVTPITPAMNRAVTPPPMETPDISVDTTLELKQSPSAIMEAAAVNIENDNVTDNDNDRERRHHPSVGTLSLQFGLSQIDIIRSKTDWEQQLLKVFDFVLPDIFHNLEDAMIRFRKTQEFQSLTDQ